MFTRGLSLTGFVDATIDATRKDIASYVYILFDLTQWQIV